jgi:hypothetical protein
MKKTLFLCILAGALLAACGGQQQSDAEGAEAGIYKTLPGDSTRYGLACDGSTDSILVFLPYGESRLDTFDIITAFQNHKIFGLPHIGDDIAVIVNPEDTVEALMVINLERLQGTWCYMVTPTLRHVDKMSKRMQRRMMERIPDSLLQQWMAPREYSLRLKSDHGVTARGGVYRQTTTDDMTPVEYPAMKRYTDWYLYNGRLILKADTIAGFTQEGDVPTADTVNIVMLRRDTLVLQFPDHEQSYYRKEKE